MIPNGNELRTKSGVALNCALYGVKTNNEYWEHACEAFHKKATGQSVSGTVEKVVQGISKVTLFVGLESVQEALIKTASARLTQKEKAPTKGNYADWKKAQENAKLTRKNMWKYGDVGSDNEDDY